MTPAALSRWYASGGLSFAFAQAKLLLLVPVPGRRASSTVTAAPRWASPWATAAPTIPAPTTTTLGTSQPSTANDGKTPSPLSNPPAPGRWVNGQLGENRT